MQRKARLYWPCCLSRRNEPGGTDKQGKGDDARDYTSDGTEVHRGRITCLAERAAYSFHYVSMLE